jgi:hypothetical protein
MFHHICIYIFKALKDKRTDVVSQLKYLQSETEQIYMFNFILYFCPHTAKHRAVLSHRTSDTQLINLCFR